MISYTYNDTTYLFFESTKVKVFPSAYRGHILDGTSENSKIYNPESRMLTEYTATQRPLTQWKSSYIVDYTMPKSDASTDGELKLVIGGYYFEISGLSKSDFNGTAGLNNYPFLFIVTRDEMLTGDTTTTKVLSSIFYTTNISGTNPGAQADADLDRVLNSAPGISAFIGLAATTTKPTGISDNSALKLLENNKILQASLLPELHHGKGIHATIIGDSTNGADSEYSIVSGNNSSVAGNYSSAIGDNLKAGADYQYVIGKYNQEDNSNNSNTKVEIVGYGTETARKNIRTLDRSGNETLTGNLLVAKNINTSSELYAIKNTLAYGGANIKNDYYQLGNLGNTSEAQKTKGIGSYYFKDKNGYWTGFMEERLTDYNKSKSVTDPDTGETTTTATIPTTNLHFGIRQYKYETTDETPPDYNNGSNFSASYFDLYANDSARWAEIATTDFTPEQNCGTNLGTTTKQWNNIYSKRVEISSTTDVTGNSNPDSAPLVIGSKTGDHLELDGNEIYAKVYDSANNSWKPSTLHLQLDGGSVIFSNNNTGNNKTSINGGDITTNNIKLTGMVQSNLVPNANNTLILGQNNNGTITKWKEAYIGTTYGNLEGNADTATKLNTSRSINGTAFDGTSAITTSKWGTKRTITIKDNDGTNSQANTNIDGSANFNLLLPATIKATLDGAATSATNDSTGNQIVEVKYGQDRGTSGWGAISANHCSTFILKYNTTTKELQITATTV